MKKNLIVVLTFLIMFLIFPSNSKAELVCDRNIVYNVQKTSCELLQLNGLVYGMNLYNTTLNGSSIKTYCIDPTLKSGTGDNRCVRRIDPSDSSNGLYVQAYDVAVTRAYQILTNDGRNTTSTADRIIGEIIFRWLGANYGQMSSNKTAFATSRQCGNNNYVLSSTVMLNIYANPFLTNYWNTGNTEYNYAKSVFQQATAAGNMILTGQSYEDVFNSLGMWQDEYSFNTTTEYKDGLEYITVNMNLTNDVQNVYWSQFRGGCSNTTVKCATMEASGSGNTGKVVIQVTKAADYNGQSYGIYVDSSIYDIRSSSANMIIVQGGSSLLQRMLLVADSSANITSNPNFPRGGRRHYPDHNNSESCLCDTNTGTWTYQKYQDGSRIEYATWKETDSNFSEMMQKYQGKGCPTTCSKAPDKHVCEIVDGKHYCEDGEPCDEDEYIKDCLCNPVVTIPSDCNDFDTATTENGYISDIATTDKNCNNSNVVDQIKKCVIDNTDARDESFEATNELNGNPYCKVWCSESYDFKLPTAQYSTSGGYFTLATTISGKRDCYISSADNPEEPIDEAKFNEDLTKAQNEVISAYNEYAKWKAAAATKASSHIESDSAPGRSCGPGSSPSCNSCSGDSASVTVYEKEWSWTAYRNDGSTYADRASYSSGSVSCGTCSCSAEEGDDPDASGGTYHVEDRDNALATLKEKINNLNTIISQYNSCTGVITNNKNSDLASVDASSTTSSSWDNDMQFDPTVDFTYDQDYINQMSGSFEQVNNSSDATYMYCSGDTNDKYECQSGQTSSIATTAKSILTCDEGSCSWKNFNVSTAKWIRKTKTNSADYQVAETFSTYTQYGTIKVQEGNDNDYLWTTLPEGSLPVSLITKTGVFPFKFTFGNIGQSNTISGTNGLGRLIDNEDSNSITVDVLTKYNELDSKYKCDGGASSTTDGGYVCHYLNNCPGCDFTCDDDNNCEFDDCDGGYCILECPNCVFDGEKSNFSYRTVSLNKLFPNDRTPGYNWNKNSNDKAKKTLEEITNDGESIYETPQYSYTLTPANLKNIREYNDKAVSYTNSRTPITIDSNDDEAIYCETVEYNGISYNVKCKSRFLDIIENSKYKNVYVQSDSIIRNEEWTLYDGTIGNNIGPAWK